MGSEDTVNKLLKNIRNSNTENKNIGKNNLSTKVELSTRDGNFSYNEEKKNDKNDG